MNVCERVCACLSSCLPKRVCACTLSVWNVAAAVYFFERSCVPSSGAGVAVMSAQQRTSDETNASLPALWGSGHSIGHERTHSRIAHSPSIYLETFYRSIEAGFRPFGHVTLSWSSRTIERACMHPYTHSDVDTWTHALILWMYHKRPHA